MSKVERRVGIINASFFSGEITEIVTISLTSDGSFDLIGSDEVEFTDATDFIDHIEGLHKANTYSAFVMDCHGVNKGVIDVMRNSGLPVLSMEDMFLAIGAKIDCDAINSTPNRYTPKPQVEDDPDSIVAMDGNSYKVIMEVERKEKSSITQSHVVCVAQSIHWLSEANSAGNYTKDVELLSEVQYFLQNMLDVENGIEQGYLSEGLDNNDVTTSN